MSSTWTTASAPLGTGAPVLILATYPAGKKTPLLSSPAAIDVKSFLTPAPSAERTAYPSLIDAGKGGNATLLLIVCETIRFVLLRISMFSVSTSRT